MLDLSGKSRAWPAAARELFGRCLAEANADERIWRVAAPLGDDRLRVALTGVLGRDADHLWITTGVRTAAAAVAATRRTVLLERPTYDGVAAIFDALAVQVELHAWDALAALPLATPVDTAYWVTSPGRNPDGASLTAEVATALEQRAAEGALVVVNEIYRWYGPTPAPVRGAVAVGSLHKLAGLGSHLGWVAHRDLASLLPRAALGHPPPRPWQRAWALFVERGGFEQLVEAVVSRVEAARDAFAAAVGSPWAEAIRRAAGPSALLGLPPGWSEEEAIAALAAAGVAVIGGTAFSASAPSVRVGFAAVGASEAEQAAQAFRRVLVPRRRNAADGY